MHCCLMFISHSFVFSSFAVVVLGRFFFFLIWETKKRVAGCIRQVIILYSNYCMGICLGRLNIGHLRQVVVVYRWLFE